MRDQVSKTLSFAFLFATAGSSLLALAQDSGPKPATEATKAKNAAALQELPFTNTEDFVNAERGLIAPIPNNGVVVGPNDAPVWDLNDYSFFERERIAPDTVNLSLWRQGQLVYRSGLFKVTDRIYQVRGIDISNITFIEGETGVIVMDPLVSDEVAKVATALYFQHRPKKPIKAVIYTHSHGDHFGGAAGVVSAEDVRSGKIPVIAPQGFVEEATSENLLAGNVMLRRASYMYGTLLPKGPQGNVGTGLGLTLSTGNMSFILPTKLITQTGEKLMIDGLTFVFQMAPHTEAPAEMHFFIPELGAFCPAENATHTQHNLYTLRGAKIRNPVAWASALNESIELFGPKMEVMFAPHHWPTWGNANIVGMLKKERDLYQYINDQTLRLANHGYNMTQIAERLTLPPSLSQEWYNRGYYGSVNHNVKSVYVNYLGWFDGNPATLHPLSTVAASKKYVEFMGGAEALVAKARSSFAEGDYRWVAQVVNHVVMADPSNTPARELQADALEQLGYQDENGPWRNFYLTGAQELRQGVRKLPAVGLSPGMITAMDANQLFDYVAVRLNGEKAAGHELSIEWNFSDTQERVFSYVENSVLHHSKKSEGVAPQTVVTSTRPVFTEILTGKITFADAVKFEKIKASGDAAVLEEFAGMLDTFEFWFNIVTPNP